MALVGQYGSAPSRCRSSASGSSSRSRRRVSRQPKRTTSTGSRKARRAARRASRVSATTTNRSRRRTTIFSRSSAPPPPLISRELRVHLVGAVDRQVELDGPVQLHDLDARRARELVGALGGHRRAQRRPSPRAEQLDHAPTPRGRSRARSSCPARPAPRPPRRPPRARRRRSRRQPRRRRGGPRPPRSGPVGQWSSFTAGPSAPADIARGSRARRSCSDATAGRAVPWMTRTSASRRRRFGEAAVCEQRVVLEARRATRARGRQLASRSRTRGRTGEGPRSATCMSASPRSSVDVGTRRRGEVAAEAPGRPRAAPASVCHASVAPSGSRAPVCASAPRRAHPATGRARAVAVEERDRDPDVASPPP